MSKKRAYKRKFHYIYKTTCKVTNRYYYGMHSTDNLNDGYLGSGKCLWHSINKYGRENHSLKILEYLPSREKLREREVEIVNEELLQDPLCMNLMKGGYGEFSLEAQKAGGRKVYQILNQRHNKRIKIDEEYKQKWLNSLSKAQRGEKNGFYNKKHSEEAKEKMRNADRTGIKNSQYGTCWITNGKENKKVHRGDDIPEDWFLGRKI